MSEHTPGSWIDDPNDIDGDMRQIDLRKEHGFTKIRGSNSQLVCEVDVSDAEGEANARLIVAAPDLLEAAKTMLRNLEQYGHVDKADRLLQKAVKKAESQPADMR